MKLTVGPFKAAEDPLKNSRPSVGAPGRHRAVRRRTSVIA